ncbi:hypothetical protein PABG_05795 [Paracoccidioides brasiliensis Pb03]|nr:hypothetical protein PABG_05795 [Paracoccidioides brasiliensis Pb03]
MARVSQKTLNWLHRVLSNAEYGPDQAYKDPSRTYNDVANLLFQHPDFTPQTDVYTYENGTPALLLHISGTLPVTFRGAIYRFPLTIWVPKAYPHEPPMMYVTPTQDMLVRPGQHVSGEGRVYHHYLAHWADAWDRSTIVDFLYILRDIFAKEPPVISKQQQNISHMAPPPKLAPPIVPPLPRELIEPASAVPWPSIRNPPLPQLPPKPAQMVTDPRQRGPFLPAHSQPSPLAPFPNDIRHQRTVSNAQIQSPHIVRSPQQRSNSLRQFTPPTQMGPQPPELPLKQGFQQGGYRPQFTGPVSPNTVKAHPPIQPVAPVSRIPPFQPRPLPRSRYPQGPYVPPLPHPGPQALPQPGPQPLAHPRPIQAPSHGPVQFPHPSHQPLQPVPVKIQTGALDLLASPFELELPSISMSQIAPPIPPNPEKDALLRTLSKTLTQTLQANVAQIKFSLHPLQSQSKALKAAISTLEAEISFLNYFRTTIQSNTAILQQSLRCADAVIADAKARLSTKPPAHATIGAKPPSLSDTAAATAVTVTEYQRPTGLPAVDDVLVAPTVVGKQVYDLVADERGIQRAIYVLQAALVKGRVSVDTWVRLTRGLAREAFLKRALLKKAGKGMGLVVEEG